MNDSISLCNDCHCMTHTTEYQQCGKCGQEKSIMNGNTPDQEELREKIVNIIYPDPPATVYANDIADKIIQLFAQQPSSQAIEGWWICTDFLSKGGQKVMGPFVSRDYAFAARTQLEKLNAPVTYWIDSLTTPDETGREA